MKKTTLAIVITGSIMLGALLFWFALVVNMWHNAYVLVEQYNAAMAAQQAKLPQASVTPTK